MTRLHGAPMTLVTGATGLVGNNVVRQLLLQGHRVRVLVRRSADPRPLAGLAVETVEGGVEDSQVVAQACRGVDHVIHAAGYVQIGSRHLDRHREVNVVGTSHVASAARAVGARMVHVSTCDALGIGSPDQPADETTPLEQPLSVPYVLTKREAEEVVAREVERGLQAVIVNPAFMLGPWDWKPSSGRMLLEVALGRGLFAPTGTVSLCDVRDVATAIVHGLSRGKIGDRYALAGVSMSYLDAWRLFAQVAGRRPPFGPAGPVMLFVGGWSGDIWAWITGNEPPVNSMAIAMARVPKHYNSAKAAAELGYTCRDVRETVHDAWCWFRDHGFLGPVQPSSRDSTCTPASN
jgi:dihydroflavonol-4-reductase